MYTEIPNLLGREKGTYQDFTASQNFQWATEKERPSLRSYASSFS